MNTAVEKGRNLISSENYKDALNILLPHAEKGNSEAQAAVGLLYQTGLGVKRDIDLAIKWLKRAAKQGNGEAAHNLGTLYLTCEPDLPLNKEKSKCWFNKANELGFKVGDSI